MTFLYTITHKTSGKSYVGLSKNARRRWIQHRYVARNGSGKHLHAALRKHGEAAFRFEVCAAVKDLATAARVERAMIATGGFIYNHSAGGEINTGDSVSLKKLGARLRGRTYSEETLRRMSAGQRERFRTQPHPRKGVKHTPEVCALLSQKQKAFVQTEPGKASCRKGGLAGAAVRWKGKRASVVPS